ncbi:MAG: D-alanyl-D-alanine carboxypeptidase family protein [Oliverpabstia sp.]
MNKRNKRRSLLLLLFAAVLLSANITCVLGAEEQPIHTESSDTVVEGQEESTESSDDAEEPERLEPDAYFEPVQTDSIESWPAGPAVWAESAVVMDMDTGTFLYSKNMDATKYPASITKIMTTLLAIENASPNERVTFSEHAIWGIERNSSHIGIRIGEILSMKDCWYGMMLESANEVCLAVAEHIGGSVERFVEMMNQKAAALGCTGTHFTNPNGLPDENHYTTAHDMALIAQAAYKNKTFRQVCGTKVYKISKTNVCGEERWLGNHHKMLPERPYAYEGCTGGKTGFTTAALNTLVTYAERDGRRLVCVSLRTNGPQIYVDTASMLDYGFSQFQNITLYSRSGNAGSGLLYPSFYFGEFCTIDQTRPSVAVTLPAAAGLEQMEIAYSQTDTGYTRTYMFHQQTIGKESVPRTELFAKPQTILATPITETVQDTASTVLTPKNVAFSFQTIKKFLKELPLYFYLLSFLLLLLIVMEIVLMIRARKRKKRRKKKKR